MQELIIKNKEIIKYLVFGTLTTLVKCIMYIINTANYVYVYVYVYVYTC